MGIITFKGKPLEKLVEVISQGIGALHKPRSIRKEADANAYKISVIAKAKAQAASDSKLIEVEMYDAIEQRILFQEQRKQNNILSIIEVATEQINHESNVNSETVDPDWTTRFFSIAENISNEEMQKLWGRILAGEVKQPGGFSLRTLDVMKNLSKQEADIFTKFAELNVKYANGDFIPYVDKQYFQEKFNILYTDIVLMVDLGLVSSEKDLGLSFTGINKPLNLLYEIGNIGIYVSTIAHNKSYTIPILSLTKVGSELATLISFEPNSEYLNYVCKALTTENTKITLGKVYEENGKKHLKNVFEYQS